MSIQHTATDSRAVPVRTGAPTWWLVFTRELHELWVGGKAPVLLLMFSILLGGESYVIASNSELSLMPPKEMVYETLKTAIAVGLFIGLIIGADSISGERERSTLETLLLTPTSRRQIMVGKFLAALSPWPAALLITIPFMTVLGQGDEVVGQAIPWGIALGTVLAVAYTGIGMLVSFWSNTNRTSYFVSLGIYVLILVPAQLPGRAQTGAAGQFLQWVNPLAAAFHFLSKILVNNRTIDEFGSWLISPAVLAVLVVALLFLYASSGLRLEAGAARRFWSRWGRAAAALVIGGLVALAAAPRLALAQSEPATDPLEILIDTDYKTVKTGDAVLFSTTVANTTPQDLPPVIVAMNIINLDKEGDVVDPEDWSPERTQYIDRLAPGESAKLAWRVNAILDGDYIVYMVALPEPAGEQSTSQAVASSGLHLTVTKFTRLNPGGVLPYAIGTPLLLGALVFMLARYRRRSIDVGEE